jgi:hypothetical protein
MGVGIGVSVGNGVGPNMELPDCDGVGAPALGKFMLLLPGSPLQAAKTIVRRRAATSLIVTLRPSAHRRDL